MQYDILVWVVFFLMVFILAIQIQISDLSRKLQEIIKKVDGLLNERLKETRSDIKLHNTPLNEQLKETRSDIKLHNTPL
ncbi:MAG: hypothetical protein ABSF79_04265 [Smithellaceae bacterium]|jgi:gas vesicle protein